MTFGKFYTRKGNPRSTAILAVAKANDIKLDVVEVDTKAPAEDFLKLNSLGKIPVFEGTDGYVLHESIAIAIYITSQNEKTTLLGKTKQDYASILKWLSYFNQEILTPMSGWYRPLIGLDPYNKKVVTDNNEAAIKAISQVEQHLHHHTYLVGERITLADLFATSIIARGYELVFDKKFRETHPALTRWYETVYNQPIFSAVAPKFELRDVAQYTNVAPKKPDQPKKEAAPKAAAPKAAAKPKEADEEDEKPAEPKPKHPLDLLPRATFPLDEWKRQYSNTDTPVALKWFWENIKFDEYSIWKVKYKYNDELTLTFMSNNLIGGFNTRLEGSRKFLFGCASVYGENNDSIIEGAFVIRGDDYYPVFEVAPDYESYDFIKLDPTKAEDKEYLNEQWTWEKPVVVNGKSYKHADGKVFK